MTAGATRKAETAESFVERILNHEPAALARAITLIESSRADHRVTAQQVLSQLLPHTGESIRLGISGIPGAGKSTLIDTLGQQLLEIGRKLAILTIDPSSVRTGGSILGDKTRMQNLSNHPDVFIRPSPTAGSLGGVARATRESILLCEAAGFDFIIVETVGVGQSEISLSKMVDFFLLLLSPSGGDELQGIKKGVLEVAHMVTINKADPADPRPAELAASAYRQALHLVSATQHDWQVPVTTCSALHNIGIEKIIDTVNTFHAQRSANGRWQSERDEQQVSWMWSMIEDQLLSDLRGDEAVKKLLSSVTESIRAHEITPSDACEKVLGLYRSRLARP